MGKDRSVTNEPKCECGSDDFNARSLSEGDRRVPHALNCPKHPNAPAAPKVEIIDLMGALKRSLDHPKPAPAPKAPEAEKACEHQWGAAYIPDGPEICVKCETTKPPEPKQGTACPGCGHQKHGCGPSHPRQALGGEQVIKCEGGKR